LGDHVEAVLREIEECLAPFSRHGAIAETIVSTAEIVKR
jgi:hypothetical protein